MLFLLVACSTKDIEVGEARSAEEACAAAVPETTTLSVEFPEQDASCAWGEDGNVDAADATVTARTEESETLDLGDVSLCDLTFDFAVESQQTIRYDDHFFLTFDDAVLASSSFPLASMLEQDGDLRVYSWDAMVGAEMDFDPPTYCPGEAEGTSMCAIPATETTGVIALDLGEEIIAQFAELAFDEGRVDFGFVTIGDNDPDNDCSHGAFTFDVEVSYVENG